MKIIIFWLLITITISTIFFILPASAQSDVEIQAQSYCQGLGYTYNETNKSCIFPDGKNCLGIFFYSKNCGQEYAYKLPCLGAGKQESAATWCCDGLDPLRPYKIDNAGNCQYLGSNIYSTCSDCGDGICDPWESSCNCRQDCKKAGDDELLARVSGRILLQVKEKGEAWYVNPTDRYRYYLGNGDSAYGIMWSLNLGISDNNLKKIPIGLIDNQNTINDKDNDGLDDQLEEAIGTDKDIADSDNDNFNDKEEILNGFNPNGSGLTAYDQKLVNRLKGRILLQVEGHGEAWYLNPADGKRYYLKDGETAYQLMSKLGLGISNEDLFPITRGGVFIPYHNKLKKIDLNGYSIAYPLGWTITDEFDFGFIKLLNSHQKTIMGVGDNNGERKGYRIEIEITPMTLKFNETGEQLSSDSYESIKKCSEENSSIITIDGFDFFKCIKDTNYRAVGRINEKNYYISSFYANDNTIESIEKIIQAIEFKDF